MIRSWVAANYLGHANLKTALDAIKRSFENVAIISPAWGAHTDTTATSQGIGGFATIGATFCYRIEDVGYVKGKALVGGFIPHHATDNTASGGYDVTAGYYRAGVVLVNSAGTISFKLASDLSNGSAGSKARALANLIEELETTDIDDKAILAFYVVGDGTNAFTATTTLTLGTDFDIYGCGGMALSSGLSTDGGQMLGLL